MTKPLSMARKSANRIAGVKPLIHTAEIMARVKFAKTIENSNSGTSTRTNRGNVKTEFENKELAEFLEDAVQGLFALDPNAIAIVAINDDRGIAGTQYYGCSVEDKGRMIHHINEDIVMDIILNNADTIRNIIMDAENDEDETGDDEIE